MHKLRLLGRLAVQNLTNNRQETFPFALTGAFCAAISYIMGYLTYSDFVGTMRGASYVALILELGRTVMIFLSVWILAYANRFVMRRRQRELALYHVLGLQKRDIAVVLGVETLLLWAFCTVGGVAVGVLFSKLVLLVLLRLVRFDVIFGFSFSWQGLAQTALAMGVLLLALYLYNVVQLGKAKPIELLHAEQTGEREPRTHTVQAALGVLALGFGYYIAATTTDLRMVISNFFIAVVLVILGTHFLFGAGSVALLKLLRRNRKFYYKPRNFTAVSGLIFRMNANAKGLANICILVTTILVSVATTFALYAGMTQTLDMLHPHEIVVTMASDLPAVQNDAMEEAITAMQQAAAPYTTDAGQGYLLWDEVVVRGEDGDFTVSQSFGTAGRNEYVIALMTAADYDALYGTTTALDPGTALISGLPEGQTTLTVEGTTWQSVGTPQALPRTINAANRQYLDVVVPDREPLFDLPAHAVASGAVYTDSARYYWALDPAGLSEQQMASCAAAIQEAAQRATGAEHWYDCKAETKMEKQQDYYNLYGSFVFLGLFLAVMFTMATVLMIYYKQLSEGHEDRARFLILQKVGMSAAEVRATIRKQVLLVFFLPLATAALHLAAAFPILFVMVQMIGAVDKLLFAQVAALTFAVVAACYVVVYLFTARKYYSIVRM